MQETYSKWIQFLEKAGSFLHLVFILEIWNSCTWAFLVTVKKSKYCFKYKFKNMIFLAGTSAFFLSVIEIPIIRYAFFLLPYKAASPNKLMGLCPVEGNAVPSSKATWTLKLENKSLQDWCFINHHNKEIGE